MSSPESKVRAAPSGSNQMLNSAAGVLLPWPSEPPITATRPRRGSSSGRSAASSAMFVSGPTGASSTGSLAALEHLGQQVDRVHRHDGRPRLRRRRAAQPVGAVHDRRVATARHDERPVGAGRDGHVLAAGQREHAQRVARRRLERQVARDRREREQVELRARQREQDRDGVVDARVAVDDERRGHAIAARTVCRRRPGRASGRRRRPARQREDVRQR